MIIRSPRERLGGYVILPRLIDKVRLSARGALPPEYQGNLLKSGGTLDGRFLSFTGLDAEILRQAILAAVSDEAVLAWVERHARPHTEREKEEWAQTIATYLPDAATAEARKRIYTEIATKVDVTVISVLDLIDLDEGRLMPADVKPLK